MNGTMKEIKQELWAPLNPLQDLFPKTALTFRSPVKVLHPCFARRSIDALSTPTTRHFQPPNNELDITNLITIFAHAWPGRRVVDGVFTHRGATRGK